MPKSLIVYFSQGGSTARVAQRIATGLRTAGYEVDLCNIKHKRPPDPSGYDLFGVGSPAYYYRPPFNVLDYVNGLPDLAGLSAFVFVLHGTYRGDAGNSLRRSLVRRGAQEVGYFHCRGADYYMGYLREGYLFSADHPTAEELVLAEAFGRDVAAHAAGRQYVRPNDDRPLPVVYRLEQFLTNRWLTRHVYSRLFRVNAKTCIACGLCVEQCPTRNIAKRKEGGPVRGRNCLFCLTCEMNCPEEAITSPATSRLSRLFIACNVRQASRDPSLDYARAVHSRGRIRRMQGDSAIQDNGTA